MKPCNPTWREELLDHALGNPASEKLAKHLASCPACTGTLNDWKAAAKQMDGCLAIGTDAEPAPHIVPRILAEVGRPPQARTVWAAWRIPLASAAIVLLAFAAYGWKQRQNTEDRKLLSAASSIGDWKSPTAHLLQPPTGQWLNTSPQLGQYFYKLQESVPAKERNNP